MRTTYPLAAVALVLLCLASSIPANAICSSPRFFTTRYSYVVTPGCESSECGSVPSSVTDDLAGVFWALGEFDPIYGAGIDSGILT